MLLFNNVRTHFLSPFVDLVSSNREKTQIEEGNEIRFDNFDSMGFIFMLTYGKLTCVKAIAVW